jgi:hypothetical protein
MEFRLGPGPPSRETGVCAGGGQPGVALPSHQPDTATNTAFSGPWGVTHAANLTPDQNTGLGLWTVYLDREVPG